MLSAVLQVPIIFEHWPPPSDTAHAAALQDWTHPPHHALSGEVLGAITAVVLH